MENYTPDCIDHMACATTMEKPQRSNDLAEIDRKLFQIRGEIERTHQAIDEITINMWVFSFINGTLFLVVIILAALGVL